MEFRTSETNWTPEQEKGSWRRANANGCIKIDSASLAYGPVPEASSDIRFRVSVPKQTVSRKNKAKKKVKAQTSREFGPYIDARQLRNTDTPISDTGLFQELLGVHVAEILCSNPRIGRTSQGSAVAVIDQVGGEAGAYGSNMLATAAHVVEDCYYADYRDVTVIYQGVPYPGHVWNKGNRSSGQPDVAAISTNAPIPRALLARIPTPKIGDVAVAIGSPGGITGTTTQGRVVGINSNKINLTTPSGPGGSGGPVFSNQGYLLGIVVAGNGSLTEAQAWPSFCGFIFEDGPGCRSW
jgi:S1-C subfamily serine protease